MNLNQKVKSKWDELKDSELRTEEGKELLLKQAIRSWDNV